MDMTPAILFQNHGDPGTEQDVLKAFVTDATFEGVKVQSDGGGGVIVYIGDKQSLAGSGRMAFELSASDSWSLVWNVLHGLQHLKQGSLPVKMLQLMSNHFDKKEKAEDQEETLNPFGKTLKTGIGWRTPSLLR